MEKQNCISCKWALLRVFQITYVELPENMSLWQHLTNSKWIPWRPPQIPITGVNEEKAPCPESGQSSLTGSHILLENQAVWNVELWGRPEWNWLYNVWLCDDHFSMWIWFPSRSWSCLYAVHIPFTVVQLLNISIRPFGCAICFLPGSYLIE